jgi:hypothetical protein
MSTELLDEMYYRDIMRKVVPGWLPHRDYSHLIKMVQYRGRSRPDTMQFFVPNRYNGWMTSVRFDEWENEVKDLEQTAPEAARLLFWGANIRVYCTCPSFSYWGHQYVMTQMDASIIPENRFPHIRNPYLKGGLCKHLARSLKVLPFHLGDMARAIKEDRTKLS